MPTLSPKRLRRLIGATGLIAALTLGLVTWPWSNEHGDAPTAQAQETDGTTDGVAPSEAEAAAEAAASGQPVEVLALRSEQREVWAQPDGSFVAHEYAAPVRTMVDGQWKDIDTTLEIGEDGSIGPVAATVRMRFSSGGEEPMATVSKNGHVATIDWPDSLPTPTLAGDTAVYAEVLPGVDLRVTALPTGFTHTLVVESAEAASNPVLESLEWPVTLDGSAVQVTADGLDLVDAGTLDAWLSADEPVMWDSSGVSEAAETIPYAAAMDLSDPAVAQEAAAEFGQRAPVAVSGSDSTIVLTPDTDLLTGPDTVYPVYIDPVFRDEYRSGRAMVASAFPSQSYYNNWRDEGLGNCSPWANCEKKRLFYRVSTSFYQGKDIRSATFGVTLENNYYHENKAHYADLYLMNSGISSATTWNNQPSGSKVATANTPEPSIDSCSYSSAHATEWNVKAEVEDAAADGTSTLTFGLRNADEGDYTKWMRFCANGHLRVEYNTAPNQPDNAEMRSYPGSSCQYTIDNDSYIDELPTLYAVATDPDHGAENEWGSSGSTVSEDLRVKFKLVWGDGDANVWESSWTPWDESGSEFELDLATVPDLPALPEGVPIGWIAKASDGISESPWSWAGTGPARCRFILDSTVPPAPTVASDDFPGGDDQISPMVGQTGSLTLSTADSEVVAYEVDFLDDTEPAQRIDLPEAGADAVVEYLPMSPGTHQVDVWALDAAGNRGSGSYSFRVSVADPVGVWALNDAVDAPTAADVSGTNPGTPGSGVTFGVDGPGTATAASFDGTADAYIDTSVYDLAPTGQGWRSRLGRGSTTFPVTAWSPRSTAASAKQA
ncbi:hypothetical protein GCM10029992_25400 [Glycomyces albus]